jgi:hypothetical protein
MNKVYIIGHGKRIWVSSSRGAAYRAVDFPEVIYSVTPHYDARYADFALIDSYSDACFSGAGRCYRSMWLTKDLLATPPVRVTTDTYQYGWGAGERMYVVTFDVPSNATVRNTWELALKYSDAKASPPYTLTTLREHTVGFVSTNSSLYLAVRTSFANNNLGLVWSGRRGLDELQAVRFPTMLPEDRYTIVNDDVGSAFINVQHDDDAWGNLYVSAVNSALGGEHVFTLSLVRAVREPSGQVQFARFFGADGVYLCNVREDTGKVGRLESIRTMITYDNGGEWFPLKVPKKSFDGRPYDCVGDEVTADVSRSVHTFRAFVARVCSAACICTASGSRACTAISSRRAPSSARCTPNATRSAW